MAARSRCIVCGRKFSHSNFDIGAKSITVDKVRPELILTYSTVNNSVRIKSGPIKSENARFVCENNRHQNTLVILFKIDFHNMKTIDIEYDIDYIQYRVNRVDYIVQYHYREDEMIVSRNGKTLKIPHLFDMNVSKADLTNKMERLFNLL